MLIKNEEKLKEVRERTVEVLESLTASQKKAFDLLEKCDVEGLETLRPSLKGIEKKLNDIDNLIVTVFALFTPEARDLREMVAFLKITSSLQRIANNEKNYIKNMSICHDTIDEDIKYIVRESLSINRCTIRAMEYTTEMVLEVEDMDRVKALNAKIDVEYSKTDDIYTLLEKDVLQMMHQKSVMNEEAVNLLKYIRKNLKIIDRLEDIAAKLMFARLGGKL